MYIYIPKNEPDKVRLFGSIAAVAKGLDLSASTLYNTFTRGKSMVYSKPGYQIFKVPLERTGSILPGDQPFKIRPMKRTAKWKRENPPPEPKVREWFTK